MRRRWLPWALTAVAVFLTEGILALTVNAASNVDSEWPLGLQTIREHPFRWALGLLVLVVLLGWLATWLLSRQSQEPGVPEAPGVDRDEFVRERAVARLEAAMPWTRESLLDRVIAELDGSGPPVVLVGLQGSGKTPLVREVVMRAERFRYAVVVRFDGPGAIRLGYFVAQLNAFLRTQGRGVDAEVLRRVPDRTALSDLIGAMGDLPVLLLLERLDRLGADVWPEVLTAVSGMPTARVLVTSRIRPRASTATVVVPVEALTVEEAAGLAIAAVGYQDLKVNAADVIDNAPVAVLGHPASLLHCLVSVDRLPPGAARRRAARAVPEPGSSKTVREIIRKLPEADRSMLYALLPLVGAETDSLIGWFPVIDTLVVGAAGDELLRSSLADSLDPHIRISDIVRDAALAEDRPACESAAEQAVRAVTSAGSRHDAEADALTPILAYRLRLMGFGGLIVRLVADAALLDRLNVTGRWNDYLAVLQLGAATAESEGEPALAAQLWLRLAGKLPQHGDVGAGEEALLRAEELVGGLSSRRLRSRLESQRGLLLIYRDRAEEARTAYLAAIEMAEDPAARCVAHKQLGHVHEMLGDSPAALQQYRTAVQIGEPQDRHVVEARIDIALSLSRTGALAEAGHRIAEVIDDIRALPYEHPDALSRALLTAALIARRAGDDRLASMHVRAALRTVDTDPRLRAYAQDLLRRWTTARHTIPDALRWALPARVRRYMFAGARDREFDQAVHKYRHDVWRLYAWTERSTAGIGPRIEQAAELRRDLVTFALGTGADRERAESVFHDTDARTIELISG